jgi:hypothetical protein
MERIAFSPTDPFPSKQRVSVVESAVGLEDGRERRQKA